MNDRFKFRFWNKIRKSYENTYDLKCCEHLDYVVPEQCTGLKDKNGKLIYEGDIVKLSSDGEAVCPVVTGFCVKYEKEPYRFNPYKKYHLIEVIGNIHENPELLEVGGK